MPFIKKMSHFRHFSRKSIASEAPKHSLRAPRVNPKSTAVGPRGVKAPVSREGNPATETIYVNHNTSSLRASKPSRS